MVKNLPAMQETGVQPLGWADPLEKGTATHSSILACRIPMDRGAWQATVLGVAKSWTQLSHYTAHTCKMHTGFHRLRMKKKKTAIAHYCFFFLSWNDNGIILDIFA